MLGGSFTSRLNNNLREQHGYTYGARSSFSFRPLPGRLARVQRCRPSHRFGARGVHEGAAGIREPLPADDVEKTKNYLALGYPETSVRFADRGTIAGDGGVQSAGLLLQHLQR